MKASHGVPLQRAGILKPFIDTLTTQGAQVERGLSRANLPLECLEGSACLVSTRSSLSFIADMAIREGISSFGWRVGASGGVGSLNATLLNRLYHATTLFNALKNVCELAKRESTHVNLWLEESVEGVYLCEKSTFPPGSLPGVDEIALWRSSVLIEIIRLFTGSNWCPPAIGLAIKSGISPLMRADLPHTRFHITPKINWHFLPSSILCNPCRLEQQQIAASREEPAATDLVGSLVQLIRPYLKQGTPGIDLIAEMAGVSRRTLQRRLAEAGCSYSDLINRGRFNTAKTILRDPKVKIIDAAHELGYKDPSNFARAFKNIAGVSPREYRKQRSARVELAGTGFR